MSKQPFLPKCFNLEGRDGGILSCHGKRFLKTDILNRDLEIHRPGTEEVERFEQIAERTQHSAAVHLAVKEKVQGTYLDRDPKGRGLLDILRPVPPETSHQASGPLWGPRLTPKPGPEFLELGNIEKSEIRKLHNDLGHPTPEELADFLKERNAQEHLIGGARHYVCDTCI